MILVYFLFDKCKPALYLHFLCDKEPLSQQFYLCFVGDKVPYTQQSFLCFVGDSEQNIHCGRLYIDFGVHLFLFYLYKTHSMAFQFRIWCISSLVLLVFDKFFPVFPTFFIIKPITKQVNWELRSKTPYWV